jgi:hypothetical protein
MMSHSLLVYSALPPCCILHLVQNEHSQPDFRPGEWAVIDTEDRSARNGDVYLIEWMGGRRNICRANHHPPSSKPGALCWMVSALRKGLWTETAFPTAYLESKLLGAVIGIYQASEREHLRLTGGL